MLPQIYCTKRFFETNGQITFYRGKAVSMGAEAELIYLYDLNFPDCSVNQGSILAERKRPDKQHVQAGHTGIHRRIGMSYKQRPGNPDPVMAPGSQPFLCAIASAP
jgi:hypothetical protein